MNPLKHKNGNHQMRTALWIAAVCIPLSLISFGEEKEKPMVPYKTALEVYKSIDPEGTQNLTSEEFASRFAKVEGKFITLVGIVRADPKKKSDGSYHRIGLEERTGFSRASKDGKPTGMGIAVWDLDDEIVSEFKAHRTILHLKGEIANIDAGSISLRNPEVIKIEHREDPIPRP